MDQKLNFAYLGGKMPGDRYGEEHEVVFVVAGNKEEARQLAKEKWAGEVKEGLHVDCLKEITDIDGWKISVHK